MYKYDSIRVTLAWSVPEHLDTGVIIGGDRAAVERAATYAIELLKQQKREWSPELPVRAPRTTQL